MKQLFFRIGGGSAGILLLWRILYAAGGILRVPEAIGNRSYRSPGELTAMVLIFCVFLLLCTAVFAIALALSVLAGESRRLRALYIAVLALLLYIYACLYGYPLLDNHFTTAWLMTGKYTATLIRSLLTLFAGVFGRGFHWNDTVAWYAVCACLLVYPFVLLESFLGTRNFWPVLVAALLPSFGWLVAHWCVLKGGEQLSIGAVTAVAIGFFLYYFTDAAQLGRERKERRRRALLKLSLNEKRRNLLILLCVLLWGLTIYLGRIRSFGAVMRLIFSSSVYSYQNNLYALADLRIAQALALSYILSLMVRWILSLVELENHSRYAGWMNAAYMLLLQIWVLPLLSKFMRRAADSAQGAVAGDAVADALRTPAKEFLLGMEAGELLPLFLAVTMGSAFVLLLFFLTVRLPFVRLGLWFLVWFSACTYVYCLIGLFYHSPLGNTSLLIVCYGLNRVLDRLLSAGHRLRDAISKQ